MIEVNCLFCGSGFETYSSRIKVGKGKFCSTNCIYDYRCAVSREIEKPPIEPNKKYCIKCKRDLNKCEFTIDNKRRDKLHPYCKNCVSDITKTSEYKEQRRLNEKRRLERDPNYTKKWNIPRLYSISFEEYEQLLEDQKGVCFICKNPPPAEGRIKSLFIDHDHKCCPGGKSCGQCIRKILCRDCNTMVGWFEKFGQKIWTDIPKYVEEFS